MSHANENKDKIPGFDRTLRTMEHHGHYHRKFLRGKYRRKQLDNEDEPNSNTSSESSIPTGDEKNSNDIESTASTLSKSTGSHMSRLHRGNNAFTSHKVFIELEELNEDSQDMEWKETARWIKFEEDVNKLKGGFDRPHVSTLSFHSLSDVRKGIQTGCVLLDLEATSLTHVSFQVVTHLVQSGKLAKNHREDVLKALLLRHHHEHHHSLWEDLKNTLHLHSHHNRQHLPSQSSIESPSETKSHAFRHRTRAFSFSIDEIPDIDLSKYTRELDRAISATDEDIESHHSLELDDNTEATAVLVGPLQSLEEPLLAFVRLKEARKLGNLLEVNLPVRFLFLLLGPMNCSLNYHEIGRSIATLMSNQDFHDALYQMKSESELLKAIDAFLDESIVVPPGDWTFTEAEKQEDTDTTSDEPDNFIHAETCLKKPSLIPFSGLARDLKNVFNPFRYWSDYWHGFNNFQCILVVCFVFFACLGPTLVFGGLYDEKTRHQIGEIESLLASLVFGIIFSIFAGQPLMILGVSGPLLIFDEIIFQLTDELIHVEFLTFRAWIGIWLAAFLLIVVAFQGSFLVRYFTRFSEEIIASLTVFIFLIEAIFYIQHLIKCFPIEPSCSESVEYTNTSLLQNGSHTNFNYSNFHYSNNTAHRCDYGGFEPCHSKFLFSNTALFSILMIFGTFWLLLALRRFRHSKFLRKIVRHFFSDFGILISLTVFTIIAFLVRDKIYVETVGFPETFEPTTKRSWLVSPFGMKQSFPVWAGFFACIPALILCILIVMETQLTSLLIAKKHHRLRKPVGFHLDLLLVAFFAAVSGFLGFPWFCGVAVRSLQHVQALAIYSRETSPGVAPHIIGIREQRVTNLLIHVLIGVCIPILWAAKIHLRFSIPLPVLFGGLIYLGFISWKSLQFAVRLRLMFMPSKHHPTTCYVKNVRPSRMHSFTIVQLICFAVILTVKLVSYTALLFPILCLLLVPFRKVFQYFFKPHELEALDHEDDCPKDLGENVEYLSEYETTHIPI